MIVVVASIPHTGTFFVADHLLVGFRQRPPTVEPEDGICYRGHFGEPLLEQRMKEFPTIIPLRHPVNVAISWEQRGLDLQELVRLWGYVVELKDVHFLPIDSPNREHWLNITRTSLSLPLETDWRVVHSQFKGPKPSLIHVDSINELMVETRDFIEQYWT